MPLSNLLTSFENCSLGDLALVYGLYYCLNIIWKIAVSNILINPANMR